MQSIDLLILGAGPAGLSTALHLLHSDPSWGDRMLLLDKAAHPRHKLCGGGVTRLGLEILRDLDFPLPLPIPHARLDEVRLVYGNRTVHVHGQPEVVIFHRAELDAYLAAEARRRGAVIRENEAVQDFRVEGDGVRVTTDRGSYCAQVIIGADGSRGATRQALAREDRRTRVARTLELVHPAPASLPNFDVRPALFDFTPTTENLQGYFWDFPTRIAGQPAFNRGVYDARVVLQRPRARLPDLLRESLAGVDHPPEPDHPAGHPIHWFSPRTRFSLPRLLLVGDAAGVDPLFGEGIAPALGYGEVAAGAIRHAFQSGDFSFREYRRRLFASRVGRYLLLRWAVAWGSYRLSGQSWFMHLLWSLGPLLARVFQPRVPLY